jgi:DNA-binding NarL/FixJ family response regulator
MTRIFIVEDSAEILKGLREALEERPGWEVCGEASDGLEAVSNTAELDPDIVILD